MSRIWDAKLVNGYRNRYIQIGDELGELKEEYYNEDTTAKRKDEIERQAKKLQREASWIKKNLGD